MMSSMWVDITEFLYKVFDTKWIDFGEIDNN